MSGIDHLRENYARYEQQETNDDVSTSRSTTRPTGTMERKEARPKGIFDCEAWVWANTIQRGAYCCQSRTRERFWAIGAIWKRASDGVWGYA